MDNTLKIYLEKSLKAYSAPNFKQILAQEIAQLDPDKLPLQEGLATGNYVSAAPFTVMINSVFDLENLIRVKAGIFYLGIIGGCSCTDDPTPVSDINEYCELQLEIDKVSALTTVMLIPD